MLRNARVVAGSPIHRLAGLAGELLRSRTGRAALAEETGERDARPGSPERVASPYPLYRQARRHIAERAWGRASQALEAAAREEPGSPAALDLAAVRQIRRALKRTATWPSDVEAHGQLGAAYFELDLGDDALAEAAVLQRLAGSYPDGFALAALEYLFRGDYVRSAALWQAARERSPDLPSYDELVHMRSQP
jgi:hypothetical protein